MRDIHKALADAYEAKRGLHLTADEVALAVESDTGTAYIVEHIRFPDKPEPKQCES